MDPETEKLTKSLYETLQVCLQSLPDPTTVCWSKARCFSPGKTFRRKIATAWGASWQFQRDRAPKFSKPTTAPQEPTSIS